MAAVDPRYDPTSLGRILTDAGLISKSELDDALRLKKALGILLGDAIERMGLLTKHQIETALARQDHGRARGPTGQMRAAVRALNAAVASMAEHSKALAAGAENARKITLNTDLGTSEK